MEKQTFMKTVILFFRILPRYIKTCFTDARYFRQLEQVKKMAEISRNLNSFIGE